MEIFESIPKELQQFVLVVVFSLLIGMEQRRHHAANEYQLLLGTDRTLTLIGILGFIMYKVMPMGLWFYISGGIVLSAYLGIYYYNKIKLGNNWGMTSVIIALLTYSLTPLVVHSPLWMVMLIFVTIITLVEMKESLFQFSKKFDHSEFITLAKFIIIAGIVLPLSPRQNISQDIAISPYQIWISIVSVSTISYVGYLLQKFAFPDKGLVLSSVLGGLYSSTATTLILSRKSKEENGSAHYASAIIGATAMMYFRLFVLAWIFNPNVAKDLFLPFLIFILIAGIFIFFVDKKYPKSSHASKNKTDKNPLEFKTAIVFGLLFAFFGWLTNIVTSEFGNVGVNVLSFIVGITDIDPYILNLFQHIGGNFSKELIVQATLIATTGNNLMKMIYALFLGNKNIQIPIIIGFTTLMISSLFIILIR